jgi:hypothetical protein
MCFKAEKVYFDPETPPPRMGPGSPELEGNPKKKKKSGTPQSPQRLAPSCAVGPGFSGLQQCQPGGRALTERGRWCHKSAARDGDLRVLLNPLSMAHHQGNASADFCCPTSLSCNPTLAGGTCVPTNLQHVRTSHFGTLSPAMGRLHASCSQVAGGSPRQTSLQVCKFWGNDKHCAPEVIGFSVCGRQFDRMVPHPVCLSV